MKLYFQDILNRETLDAIKTSYGFLDLLPLEKFIMDFEVLTHIQEVLPDCVVKGGMAVPFHLHDETLHRLSVDIDIVTGSSREEVIAAMKKVSQKLKDAVEIDDPYVPKTAGIKKLPLLTYYCEYQLSVNETSEIKIEIFYGNSMKIQSKKIVTKTEIIGVPIDFPLFVYDHGSLIGDKLTTLPFNTIGIRFDKPDIPKQIYDIASLLKSITGRFPLEMIVDAFEKTSRDEISYFNEKSPTFEDVLSDLDNFSDKLLVTDNQIKLDPSYQGRFNKFTTELLGKRRYRGYAHVSDILLIKVIIKLILKKFNGAESETITKKAKQILDELSELSQLEDKVKNIARVKLVAKYGKTSIPGKIMKNLFPEQAYLYDQLIKAEHNAR